ncbi:hypothetical protein AQUCO_06800061v1 [Aquilegia coerulea]|uniref:Uncharacterized protein n=1 Tax=Aquilegia coerulea TaxID=218851 RepID=A0A2G5CBJ7_AQUCA|nr:hypothetical protein AQUCO_06800061v1 [Aquilegia coerulea]
MLYYALKGQLRPLAFRIKKRLFQFRLKISPNFSLRLCFCENTKLIFLLWQLVENRTNHPRAHAIWLVQKNHFDVMYNSTLLEQEQQMITTCNNYINSI